jgi:hypothetical protein
MVVLAVTLLLVLINLLMAAVVVVAPVRVAVAQVVAQAVLVVLAVAAMEDYLPGLLLFLVNRIPLALHKEIILAAAERVVVEVD